MSERRQTLLPETVADELVNAAYAHLRGDPQEYEARAGWVVDGPFAPSARVIATGAAIAVETLLSTVWRAGWLPVDVWEHVRRTADEGAVALVVDAIAADTAKHPAATIDERWTAQVRALGAEVWWDHDRPRLLQRQGLSLREAVHLTILLVAQLIRLPRLACVLPLPGSATAGTGASSGVDQKVLGRVRALLAKAESTEFPEEAEALSAKAQELMNRYAFERAVVDSGEHREQRATSIRMWLEAPYLEAKSQLVTAIGEANRCRSVLYARLGFVALVGEETDLRITELLATSLLVQATRAMVAEGQRAGSSRSRSFRHAFLVAYAIRVGERLEEASARALDSEAEADARLLPVLADRSQVVERTFDEMFGETIKKHISVSNGAGMLAGRAAADRADLTLERRAVGRREW